MFSGKLLDHFEHPRNAGKLPNATSEIEASNPVCGDILHLAAIVERGVVREVRFLCRGCTASIGCASLLTERMKGKSLHELRELDAESLSAELGGLPPAMFHAAQLAQDALRQLLTSLN